MLCLGFENRHAHTYIQGKTARNRFFFLNSFNLYYYISMCAHDLIL